MFETIGNLFTIAIWAVAIFLFGGGLFLCGMHLFTGNGWEKLWSVVAIILGIIAFTRLYAWLDSVVWCLMLTGIVLGVVGNLGSKETQNAPESYPGPNAIDIVVDEVIQYQRDKEVVKNAIREYENEH